MKFDNTFTNNDSLFLKYALLQGVDIRSNNDINNIINGNVNGNTNGNSNNDNNIVLIIEVKYKAFVKKVKNTLDYILNYFNNGQDDDHHDDQENNHNTKENEKKNKDIIDIDELLRNIDKIIGIEDFTGFEKQTQSTSDSISTANTTPYTDNTVLYPTTNITNTNINSMATNSTQNNSHPTQNNIGDDEIEQSILSFVDKLKPQSSKITIIETNHIKTEIELTSNELLILKLAVLHNNNVVNLMSQKDDIKNLMNKGLLHLSENGSSLVVDKIVEVIIKTNTHKGNMVVAEYDDEESQIIDCEEDSQEDSQEDKKEDTGNEKLSFDGYNKNVQSFEWSIDCCADKQVSNSSSDI